MCFVLLTCVGYCQNFTRSSANHSDENFHPLQPQQLNMCETKALLQCDFDRCRSCINKHDLQLASVRRRQTTGTTVAMLDDLVGDDVIARDMTAVPSGRPPPCCLRDTYFRSLCGADEAQRSSLCKWYRRSDECDGLVDELHDCRLTSYDDSSFPVSNEAGAGSANRHDDVTTGAACRRRRRSRTSNVEDRFSESSAADSSTICSGDTSRSPYTGAGRDP